MDRQSDGIDKIKSQLKNLEIFEYGGRITQILGLTVVATGLTAKLGDTCKIYTGGRPDYIYAEVVGFQDRKVLLMPVGDLSGVGPDSYVVSEGRA